MRSDQSEYRRFGWAVDPEGTRFELPEPRRGADSHAAPRLWRCQGASRARRSAALPSPTAVRDEHVLEFEVGPAGIGDENPYLATRSSRTSRLVRHRRVPAVRGAATRARERRRNWSWHRTRSDATLAGGAPSTRCDPRFRPRPSSPPLPARTLTGVPEVVSDPRESAPRGRPRSRRAPPSSTHRSVEVAYYNERSGAPGSRPSSPARSRGGR